MRILPSQFVRKTLMPDEKCVAQPRFHAFYTFSAFLTLSFCLFIGWAVSEVLYRYAAADTRMPVYAAAAVGCFLFLSMMLKRWTTEIILTDQRLIYKRGFFSVEVDEIDIEQLASDNVQQSFVGRLFDFGVIHIRCIEATDLWLPPVANPYAFRNAIEKQKHQYREHYMKVERLRRHGDAPAGAA